MDLDNLCGLQADITSILKKIPANGQLTVKNIISGFETEFLKFVQPIYKKYEIRFNNLQKSLPKSSGDTYKKILISIGYNSSKYNDLKLLELCKFKSNLKNNMKKIHSSINDTLINIFNNINSDIKNTFYQYFYNNIAYKNNKLISNLIKQVKSQQLIDIDKALLNLLLGLFFLQLMK